MRHVVMFAINFLISMPLITIPWFTWWACLSVALILTLFYWFHTTNAINLEEFCKRQCLRLETIIEKLDTLIDLTKRNISNSDTERDKILDELKKIRRTVRHEVKDL